MTRADEFRSAGGSEPYAKEGERLAPGFDAYAHSVEGRPQNEWELLVDHLRRVAALAATFAEAFGSAAWGQLAGLWHDIGKYLKAFQRRIRGERIQAPHAGVGAALAHRAPPLAFVIAGHHTGLSNHEAQGNSTQSPLKRVVSDNAETLAEVRAIAPRELLDQSLPALPEWLRARDAGAKLRLEMWTRFLFSTLIDADRLATEEFYEPAKRSGLTYDSIGELRERVDTYLDDFVPDTQVKQLRADVLQQCRRKAELSPGLFSLTVPTGGGKTLASMSFALRHAERHGLRRVIVVVPYTSVIEQNAKVYRDVLASANVIEHHSAIDEAARERDSLEMEVRRRLAVDNWDAPIVITTAVQFFESLFSNQPSRCRKLHNIARSVVIIDEAQTAPTEFLLTLLDAMRQLTAHYGCSIVLTTATQPALLAREALPQGLTDVREIVGDPRALAASLRRVKVEWPAGDTVTSPSDLTSAMAEHRQVLTIVHRRRDARMVAEGLPKTGRHHLSTRMCAAHRLEVLAAIRSDLKDGKTCRVAATQLLEAGVDLSAPVVYRAMAGLDSLAQAAGRCNREGELTYPDGTPALGRFIVFRADSSPPAASLKRGLEVTEAMLRITPDLDLGDPAVQEEYFRILYMASDLDRAGVLAEREAFNFATVAERVRFIANDTHPLVVPWGEAPDLVRGFERAIARSPAQSRQAARALQPYVVQVYEPELRELQGLGAVASLEGFGFVLQPHFRHVYSAEFGLEWSEKATADVDALIV